MTAKELRQKYLDFFKSKGHTIIPSASLVPENDPSVLFTTAGMHPLVPYLLGEKHPGGTRLADVQKCIRTGDIDDVGDNRHLTFFEMLGNWSLGDYFKKEAIEWSFEFLTGKEWLGLDPKRLYVTVFKGENNIPRDEEAIEIWKKVFKEKAGMEVEVAGDDETIKGHVRIIPLGTDDNFWFAGDTGPCGGDTEMFYDVRPEDGKLEGKFTDLINSFRVMEMWNDVFMEFNRKPDGTLEKLSQHNVDTGMGIERTLAMLNGKENAFDTELFTPIFSKLEELSGMQYGDKLDSEYIKEGKQCWVDTRKQLRIVADHLKAATFMIADGVVPSNTHRGYVLRRLVRRAVRYGKLLGIENNFTTGIAKVVIGMYGEFYTELRNNEGRILEELEKEENKFRRTLERGLNKIEKYLANKEQNFVYRQNGEQAEQAPLFFNSDAADLVFDLFQTDGFPTEMSLEEIDKLAKKLGVSFDRQKILAKFNELFKQHQGLSRTASAGMFKGGLADHSEEVTKLHTAAHLLLAGLRKVLGDHVIQKGSNITAERLRFDFSQAEKLTQEQKEAVEAYVNAAIAADAPVSFQELSLDEARNQGAMGVFDAKYGEKVKVYTAEKDGVVYSKEICGGPHVEHTGILGKFKIQKEESSSAGVRRIKAILE